MITQESVNACTNALAVLKQAGYKAVADMGSPIDILNRATNISGNVYDNKITDEQFLQTLSEMTKAVKPEEATGATTIIADTPLGTETLRIDDHEPTLFDLRRMSVQHCVGLLDFGRNVVQPFVQQVLSAMDNSQAAEVTEDWELVPVSLDQVLAEPVVLALIDKEENPHQLPFSYEAMPVHVPAEIPAPTTGKKSYDDLVNRLLGEMGMTPNQAMTEVLREHNVSPINERSYVEVRKYVIGLLLAAYYHDNVWPDSGVSITVWRTTMLVVHKACAGWLFRYIKEQETTVRNGMVVRYYDRDNKRVFINTEAFEKFTSAGGSPECLLGAIYQIDDNGPKNISLLANELVKNQEQHVSAWERRSSIRRIEADTDWLRNNRTALKTAFTATIQTIDEGLLPEGKDKAVIAACSAVEQQFTTQTNDVTEFIIGVTCNSVFAEHDTHRLLSAIHHGVINGQSPESAATDWVIDYYLDYALMGVLIEK